MTDYADDGAGRLVSTTGAAVNDAGDRPTETLTYTPAGAVATRSATSAAGSPAVARYAYDAHRAQIEALGPRSEAGVDERVTQSYNPFGQVSATSRRVLDGGVPRDLATTYAYDLASNSVAVSHPAEVGGSLVTTYAFDPLGRLASTTDPGDARHTTTYDYDNEGNQVGKVERVDGAAVRTLATTYNPDLTVASVVATDHASGATLAACNYAPGADPTTGYDPDGRLLHTRSVAGTEGCGAGTVVASVADLAYDAGGRLAAATQGVRNPADGTFVTRAQAFTSAPDGQPASVTHAGASTAYAYEASGSGRLGSIADWRGVTTAIAHQPAGGLAGVQAGTTASLAVDRHPDGSPSAMTWTRDGDGATLRSHTAIAYDPGGLTTSESVTVLQPPGSSASTGGTATYDYDLAARLVDWSSPYGGAATAYTLDDAGNVMVEDGPTTTTMTYVDGRLSSVTEGAGPPRAVHHDALGQEIDPAGGTITYDPMGRTATRDGISYTYDARGRLVARVEGSEVRLYFYLGLGRDLAEEADGGGATVARYLRDAAGGVLASESWVTPGSGSPTWTWLLSDPGGNVATRVDDAGAVVAQSAYQPWGEPDPAGSATDPSATDPASLGFGGALTDPASGLLALGGRLYDPEVASFTTPDSFLEGGSDLALGTDPLTGNRYVFAASNPVAYFDNGYCWAGRTETVQRVVDHRAIPVTERYDDPNDPRGVGFRVHFADEPIYEETEVCRRSGLGGAFVDFVTANDTAVSHVDPDYSNPITDAAGTIVDVLEDLATVPAKGIETVDETLARAAEFGRGVRRAITTISQAAKVPWNCIVGAAAGSTVATPFAPFAGPAAPWVVATGAVAGCAAAVAAGLLDHDLFGPILPVFP